MDRGAREDAATFEMEGGEVMYLGGKARIAARLAAIINADRKSPDREIWEPFMGGLWMTAALGGNVRASDLHPGLANLYNQVRSGQIHLPDKLTPDEYRASKSLPDDSALKAFVGFGCSWGGKWFGGFADGLNGKLTYVELAKRNVELHVQALPKATFSCADFFAREPTNGVLAYLDSPYAGTTGYKAVATWDSAKYIRRINEWAEAGSILYVSEYQLPIGQNVFERYAKRTLGAMNGSKEAVAERMYRCARNS